MNSLIKSLNETSYAAVRAAHAAVMAYSQEVGDSTPDDYGVRESELLSDLVTDLLHLAAHNGWDPEQFAADAVNNVRAERNE